MLSHYTPPGARRQQTFRFFYCLLFLLMLSTLPPLTAQETLFFEEWVAQEEAGLSEVQNEFLRRIASVTDGSSNLYVAASVFNESTEVHDLVVTKYNSSGTKLWQEDFNISGGGDVLVGAIALDGSNNPIVTGAVYNGSNNYDALTVKFTTLGVNSWYALYNGSASHYDGGTSIVLDGSGNVYITGVSTSTSTGMNYLTVKYNSSGTQQWAAVYDGYGYTDAASVVGYTSGLVRVYGAVQKNATDWAIVNVVYSASTGVSSGTTELTPSDVVVDRINGFTTDASGNVYIVGAVEDAQTGLDFMTVKLTSGFSVAWIAYEDSGDEEDDVAKAVAVDGSGNVYVTGYFTTSTKRDFVTIKYESDGDKVWTATYNGALDGNDEGTDIALDEFDNIFVTGFSNETGEPDFHTFWLDASDGDVLWDARFNSVYNREDLAAVLRIDELGDLLVTGRTVALDSESEEEQQVTTVKYKRANIIIPPDEEEQSSAIYYIKNNGQLLGTEHDPVPDIKFYSEQTYPGLYFFDDKVSMVLSKTEPVLLDTLPVDTIPNDTLYRVDMSFGLSSRSYVMALEEREDYFNYYRGHIPEGRERVPLYQRVIHANAFAGIDIHYTSNAIGVKYDFVVKPGADPGNIELTFDGQTSLSVNGNGELVIATTLGDIILPEPVAYQIDNGEEEELLWTPEYDVDGDVVTFTTDTYDDELPLIIRVRRVPPEEGCEPVDNTGIEYSTYYGEKN